MRAIGRTFRYLFSRMGLAGVFVLSFAVAAALIRIPLMPTERLYVSERSEKLVLMHALRGVVNMGAFGSSRIYEGLDPRIFDSAFTDTTTPLHSVNLSLFGGSQTEQRLVARAFLNDLSPPPDTGVCVVLLELNAGLNLPPEDHFHPRAVNLYDADTIRFVAQFSDASVGLGRRLGRLGFALLAGFGHYVNMGMLAERIFASEDPAPGATNDEKGGRGFTRQPQREGDANEVAAAFSTRPAEVEIKPEPLEPGNYRLLQDLAHSSASVPMAGVQFMYVATPRLEDLKSAPDYPAEIEGPAGPVPIFNLARPDRYPELYKPQNWRNAHHLNHDLGAPLFSRLLASQVRSWFDAHPVAARCTP